MGEYVVKVLVYRKGELSPVDILMTDITYRNISGCEIEEFVETTVIEDSVNVLGVEDEG